MKVICQFRFGQAAISRSSHPIAGQFADGAFNGVALVHAFFERRRKHFTPARLDQRMLHADAQDAPLLVAGRALGLTFTRSALPAPLNAIIAGVLIGVVDHAELRAGLAGRAGRHAARGVHVKGLGRVDALGALGPE